MFTLRPTQKLLKKIRCELDAEPAIATTALGDWFANTLSLGSQRCILLVAEKSLLPIVMPLREAKTAPVRLRTAVRETLAEIGIPDNRMDQEIANMQDYRIARTNSKPVIGVMTEFAKIAGYYEHGTPLRVLSSILRQTPCSPIDYESPELLTRRLLGGPRAGLGAV